MAEIEEKVTGPGNKLAKARRAAGFSREEVAEKLHLSIGIIRQLENNEYDEQIPDAFARGYLRNYAKLLELDPQEIIARYSQMIGSSMVKNYYEPSQNVASKPMTTPLAQIVLWLVIVVVIVVASIWYMSGNGDQSETVAAEQNAVTEPEQTVDENTQSAMTVQASESTLNVQDGPDNSINLVQEQPQAVAVDSVPTGFQETAEAQLEFNFVGDCWVQVTDANGEVMAVGLKTAGRRFEVSGIAPINIVLGKPRQVDITYNDESVDLSCFPSGTTARFELSDAQACGGM